MLNRVYRVRCLCTLLAQCLFQLLRQQKRQNGLGFNKSLYLQAVLVLLGMDDFDELPPNFSTDVGWDNQLQLEQAFNLQLRS